jgi:hypothetical protein
MSVISDRTNITFFTRCTNYLNKDDANGYINEIWWDVGDFRIFTVYTFKIFSKYSHNIEITNSKFYDFFHPKESR